MEINVHYQVLATVFVIAAVLGIIVSKTNFCTMGAVSDWVNMGDHGRMRAWLLAMAVAMGGVAIMEAFAAINLGSETFPPYRAANFSWLRFLVGGTLFGIGMHLFTGTLWAVFHILIVLLQAFIFMMLTLVYIGQAHAKH